MLKHPSGQNRFANLANRFMKLQGEHRKAAGAMWIGTLAAAFTDEELNALESYLSPNDVQALRRVRQPLQKDQLRPDDK